METRWLWKEISDYLQVRGDFGSSFSAIKCWSHVGERADGKGKEQAAWISKGNTRADQKANEGRHSHGQRDLPASAFELSFIMVDATGIVDGSPRRALRRAFQAEQLELGKTDQTQGALLRIADGLDSEAMRGCTEQSSERLTTRKYGQGFALGLWQGVLPAPTQLGYRYVAVEGEPCPWTWEVADEGGLRHPRWALYPLCKAEAGDVTRCMARCKKVEQARKLAVLELDELLVSTQVREASTGRDRVVPCPDKALKVTRDATMTRDDR